VALPLDVTKQENQNEKTASSSHGNFYAKHFCRSSSAKNILGKLGIS
jgi:hypothetical protein